MHVPLQHPLLRAFAASPRRAVRIPAVFGILLTAAIVAPAQRRDFPASYSIAHVVENGNSVELTFSLTVHNYSGRDIEDGGIVLDSSGPLPSPIASFDLVKAFARDRDVAVRRRFTVPKAEYARWQQGVEPALEILIPDGRGGTRIDRIDARPEAPLPDPAE